LETLKVEIRHAEVMTQVASSFNKWSIAMEQQLTEIKQKMESFEEFDYREMVQTLQSQFVIDADHFGSESDLEKELETYRNDTEEDDTIIIVTQTPPPEKEDIKRNHKETVEEEDLLIL
jgi:hypothetical protein